MKAFFKIYSIAFESLIAIPTSFSIRASEEERARASAFFPVVGLFLGIVMNVTHRISLLVLPEDMADFLAIVVLALASGGFHLKGFGDWLERFLAGEEAVGSNSTAREFTDGKIYASGIILIQWLQFLALTRVPSSYKSVVLTLMPMVTHWVMIQVCYGLRFFEVTVSPDFCRMIGLKEVLTATVFSLAVLTLYLRLNAATVAAIMIMFSMIFILLHRIKGRAWREDVLGAVGETSGLLFLVSAPYLNF